MKKSICTSFMILCSLVLSAQEVSEEDKVRNTVQTFFEGFHARDSVKMKSVFYEQPVIQTIGKTKEGEIKLVNEELEKVLKGIVSIPMETEFLEVLHEIEVKIDGSMANAWTPYSLFLNGSFSHCGVNNFQMIKKDDQWKVIYLVDTRRREGCENKNMP